MLTRTAPALRVLRPFCSVSWVCRHPSARTFESAPCHLLGKWRRCMEPLRKGKGDGERVKELVKEKEKEKEVTLDRVWKREKIEKDGKGWKGRR